MDEETRVTVIHTPMGDEASNDDGCLVLIYPPGPSLGRRFPLVPQGQEIGRGQDCDIQLDRDAVSRHHARIDRGDEGWRVTDLDSTNGSYVNEARIHRPCPLRDGDRLKIGNTIFKFLAGGNVETAYHEEIYRMAIVDGLTQVHNKRYFLEQLENELARCGRHGRPLSLVMFDIDHFKRVNDQHGHLTGDHVLRSVAARVRPRVRKHELLARYGGEEFVLLLPEATREQGMHLAEVVRRLIADEPFHFEAERITVTVSLGVATVYEDLQPASFVRLADECLYRAKHEGRNRVVG